MCLGLQRFLVHLIVTVGEKPGMWTVHTNCSYIIVGSFLGSAYDGTRMDTVVVKLNRIVSLGICALI